MPRPLSERFVLGLDRADESKVGVKLARLCIKANLPSKYVAEGLDISRMTLHAWYREGKIRNSNNIRIQKFIDLVEQGLADGVLPANNLASAKVFVESEVRPVL